MGGDNLESDETVSNSYHKAIGKGSIRQIFLDLDGPLLDGKERHYHCYCRILEKYGFKPIGIEEYWGLKRALVNRRVLLNMSAAGEIYDRFLEAWLSMIESPELLALDKVQKGAIDCLASWKELGMELILVTMRKSRQALEEQLKLTGLRAYLDSVLVCNHAEGGMGKATAVREFSRNQLNNARALWIGDTEADWEAARVLECEVVLLSNGLRNEDYLLSLPGAVVKPSILAMKDYLSVRANVS